MRSARSAFACSFSTAGLFAEELKIAFRLLHSVSRMEATLKIRAGYDIAFNCFQEVPMLLMLSVHPSRQQDLLTDHVIRFSPNVQACDFSDAFGNLCTAWSPLPASLKSEMNS